MKNKQKEIIKKRKIQENKKERRYLIPKDNPIRNGFLDSLTYLKESKKCIYFAILLFILTILIGFFFAPNFVYLDKSIEQLIKKTLNYEGFDLVAFIFQNNLLVAFISLFTGIIFTLPTLAFLISNGVLIGYVINKVSAVAGFLVIWRLIPHGIFELPAILISFGLGIKLGLFIFSKKPFSTLRDRLYSSIKVFIFIVIPLLVLAALIEGLLITFFK